MTANLNISSRLKDDQLKFKIGQRLKELRTAQGLTIDALREKLSLEVQKAGLDVKGDGVSKSMVSRWENGKSQPSAPYIRAYATLFNVDMNYILGKDLQSTTSTDLSQYVIKLDDKIYDYVKNDKDSNEARRKMASRLQELFNTGISTLPSDKNSIFVKANKNSFEELIVSVLRGSFPLVNKSLTDTYREVGSIIATVLDDPDTFIRFFLTLGQLHQRGKLDSFIKFTIDQFYKHTKETKEFDISMGFLKYLKYSTDYQKSGEENHED